MENQKYILDIPKELHEQMKALKKKKGFALNWQLIEGVKLFIKENTK